MDRLDMPSTNTLGEVNPEYMSMYGQVGQAKYGKTIYPDGGEVFPTVPQSRTSLSPGPTTDAQQLKEINQMRAQAGQRPYSMDYYTVNSYQPLNEKQQKLNHMMLLQQHLQKQGTPVYPQVTNYINDNMYQNPAPAYTGIPDAKQSFMADPVRNQMYGGGQILDNGGVAEINAGGTHEENPLGGVPIGATS
jgi:hypothetical protein